jgi:hypothetical protein
MDTTRKSNHAKPEPQIDPVYQAILVMRCKEGCSHDLLIQSRDHTVVSLVAEMTATALATSGIAAMVGESVAWFAHQDASVRHPGYGEHVARMLHDIDAAVSGEELPY